MKNVLTLALVPIFNVHNVGDTFRNKGLMGVSDYPNTKNPIFYKKLIITQNI